MGTVGGGAKRFAKNPSKGRRFSQMDTSTLTREVDERCVYFIFKCLAKSDEDHVALRLFRCVA